MLVSLLDWGMCGTGLTLDHFFDRWSHSPIRRKDLSLSGGKPAEDFAVADCSREDVKSLTLAQERPFLQPFAGHGAY